MGRTGRNICILAILLILLGVLVVVSRFLGRSESSEKATCVSELKLLFSFSGDTEEASELWFDEGDGIYYAFIPASCNASFYNIESGDELVIDGVSYKGPGDRIRAEEGVVNTARFITSEGASEDFSICFKYLAPIPSIFLNTESGSIDRLDESSEISERGSLSVIGSDGGTLYSGSMDSVHQRGNSSFSLDKKSFAIRLPKTHDLLDLGESEGWVLLAQYKEYSKVRNMLAESYVESHTDLLSVGLKYVDLYVNGEYYGLFLFGKNKSEKNLGLENLEKSNMDFNPSIRTAVPEQVVSDDDSIHAFRLEHEPADITGGYVLEYIYPDEVYSGTFPAFRTSSGLAFEVKSPENASYEEVAFIKSVFDGFERAIYSSDGIDPETGKSYTDYLDISDWADYYLVKEGFMDVDVNFDISVFMWKDSDSKDTKLHMGPVWDMDMAFGVSLDRTLRHLSDPEYAIGGLVYSDRLLEFDEVRDIICGKLESDFLPWCDNEVEPVLEGLYGSMQESFDADLVRWKGYGEYMIAGTVQASASYISDFMKRRAEFYRSYFLNGDTWHVITFYDGDKIVCKYAVRDKEQMKDIPMLYSYEAFFAGWDAREDYGKVSSGMKVSQDMIFDAKWIGSEWIVSGDLESIQSVLDDTDIIMLDTAGLRGFEEALKDMWVNE